VYGEPEGYRDSRGHVVTPEEARQKIIDCIESDGCWSVVSETKCPCCETWLHANSIGMCIYAAPTSPFQNAYVIDLMSSALDNLNGFCPPCKRNHERKAV
jgi:hypothetical protein